MKHNILIINDLDKVETVKNFPDSFEVLRYFRYFIQAAYYCTDYQIQLNYFEDPAVLIDFNDESFTAFKVNDLATILLIKELSRMYEMDNFSLYYQFDDKNRVIITNYLHLLETLLEPLEESILKRHLEIFNVKI